MKECQVCKKEIIKKPNESSSYFETKQFCSNECRLVFINSKPKEKTRTKEPKICEFCKQEFYQRDNELPNRFKKRRFCGLECGRKYSINIANEKLGGKDRTPWNKGVKGYKVNIDQKIQIIT